MHKSVHLRHSQAICLANLCILNEYFLVISVRAFALFMNAKLQPNLNWAAEKALDYTHLKCRIISQNNFNYEQIFPSAGL